jgi:hypothetical protein
MIGNCSTELLQNYLNPHGITHMHSQEVYWINDFPPFPADLIWFVGKYVKRNENMWSNGDANSLSSKYSWDKGAANGIYIWMWSSGLGRWT